MTHKIEQLKPTSAVIELPDPDDTSSCWHLEEGGVLEVRSNAPNYSYFEVEFVGTNPFSNAPLKGSTNSPVVIPIPAKSQGEYQITIHHIHNDDSNKDAKHVARFNIHPCKGCPPAGPGI